MRTALRCSIAIMLGLVFSACSISAIAQSIDPAVLGDLQKRLGTGGAGPVNAPSPVDRARSEDERSDNSTLYNGRAAEARDQLEAQRLAQQLEQSYEPTPLERDMRLRSGSRTLRQFGRDLFRASGGSQQPITGAIDDSYQLGVGDELVIIFQGSTNRSVTTRIDREGRLVVDQIRPIPAAGRRLAAVRRDLEAATRATLLGTDVFLSVGSVRAISVVVGGEVTRPGSYTLNSLSDVAALLSRAGGVKVSGSLRRIRIQNGATTRMVDLYGMAGIGLSPDVRLRDGDRVSVPATGPSVAITGSVVRSAIYELPQAGLTVRQALAMAGGALRPAGNDIVLNRIDASGREQYTTLRSFDLPVRQGDIIMVNPRERGSQGLVGLLGFVESPGNRAINVAPSIQALLGSTQNLQPDTYTPLAVLRRVDSVTRAPQYRAIDLVAALSKGRDIALRSEDELTLFSRDDIGFLQSDAVRRIVLGDTKMGQLPCRSLISLADLVRTSQSDRLSAVVRGALLIEDKAGRTAAATQSSVSNQLGVRKADDLLASRNSGRQNDARPGGDVAATNDKDETLKLDCPAVFEDNLSLLPFLIEHSSVISGSVRRPGAYPVSADTSLSTLVSVAEGLAVDADISHVEVTTGLAAESPGERKVFDIAARSLGDIRINPGDDIRILGRTTRFEAGAVLLTGEFGRPGLYSIRKGETLSQLIERAGGVTSFAYPYGAVFTRRSVKQAQKESFERISRELSQALLAVSARRQLSGDSLASAAALAKSFGETEASGRVVVEADPKVLQTRPDLDSTLEAGDTLYMPKKPSFVLATGDFLNAGALQFVRGKTLANYIEEAGGLQDTADKNRVFIVYPNGEARPVSRSVARASQLALPPGSALVAPKNVDPLKRLDSVRDIATIIGQFAVSLASIAVIAK